MAMRSMLAASALVLASAFAASAPTPASALTFMEVEMTCPVTGETFRTQIMGSGTRFGVELDTRPVGPIMASPPVPLCLDASRFPVFQREFTPDEVARIKDYVLTPGYRALLAAGDNPRYRAAMAMQALDKDPATVAFSLLMATWEGGVDPERVVRYRREARDAFAALARTEGAAPRQVAFGRFMEVELTRQLGEFDRARELLDLAEAAATPWGEIGLSEAVRRQERAAIDQRNADRVTVGR